VKPLQMSRPCVKN